MSRIRSVHPGLFTDEAFASVSMPARLLLIGIWTECFDDGIFEWKPLTLKMRIFPADSVDVAPLLDELVSVNAVMRFCADGKLYGAVRNFCRFQRPKKPNSSGVNSDEIRTYVCSEPQSSEPVRNQFGTSSEIVQQMEDGEGVGEGIGDNITISNEIVSSASCDADPAPDPKITRCKREGVPSNAILEIGSNWNILASSVGLPQIDTIDGDRKRSVDARSRELAANYEFHDPVAGFAFLFAKVRGSPFLCGQVPSRDGRPAFRATFDWCVSPKNFRKIMEGNYENQIRQPPALRAVV